MSTCPETCYRPARSLFYTGLICTIGFILFGLGSSLAAFWNVDGSFAEPRLAGTFFAAFWACFTLLGLYTLASALLARLYISEDVIRDVGCLLTRAIRLAEVTQVRWRVYPRHGSVVLRSAADKIAVGFSSLTPRDRQEVVRFLREHLNEQVQDGWPAFEARFRWAADATAS
jgi:hypothetical protein